MPKTSALSKVDNAIESAHDFLNNWDGMAWIEHGQESPVPWVDVGLQDRYHPHANSTNRLYVGCVSCGMPASEHVHAVDCKFTSARWALRQALEEGR